MKDIIHLLALFGPFLFLGVPGLIAACKGERVLSNLLVGLSSVLGIIAFLLSKSGFFDQL